MNAKKKKTMPTFASVEYELILDWIMVQILAKLIIMTNLSLIILLQSTNWMWKNMQLKVKKC